MSSSQVIETDTKLTVTADFHRLNVLLMRVDEKNMAQKVATATLSKSKIEAEYGKIYWIFAQVVSSCSRR